MKRFILVLCAAVMCLMCTACDLFDSSSKKDKRGDLGKLKTLTPYGSTVITGVQLEHQGSWRDDPEIEEIAKEHGFSDTSEFYEFELDEFFEIYIKSSTRDNLTNYIVKFDENKDYKTITEDEINRICIDKTPWDTAPNENHYGDMGGLSVDKKDGGSTGIYALVIFRFGKPEAMMKIKIVPSTAPSASDVLKELEKQKK